MPRGGGMAIPESTLSQWSHHQSGMASKQAHVSIRDALSAYNWPAGVAYDVFLQGSYKNDTNLRKDSDVDLVIRLTSGIGPRVAALSGKELQENASHQAAHERWQSFRRHALKAMRASYGDSVAAGRKTLKLTKGKIPASADLVVTLRYEDGLAFYLPDERRWVVSYPQRHHRRGIEKENATGKRYKRTIRMFKAARNRLVTEEMIDDKTAPSYFVECLLYNVPNRLFTQRLTKTYADIVDWLRSAKIRDFECQAGTVQLFGERKEQWSTGKARALIEALAKLERVTLR